MILKMLVVGPFMSNCYIVGSETTKQGIIVDPGGDPHEILETVKESGLEIKTIVLTHGHMDHFGALDQVQQATGAQVAIHTNDVRAFRQQFFGSNPEASNAQMSLVLLKGGDSIDFGDMHFLVLHTPGHSPGGVCLLGHGVLFSGDTLFNFSIGRYDTAGGDYHQEMDSIHTKLMVLPDQIVVYPGHGPETTIGMERRGNPFLRG